MLLILILSCAAVLLPHLQSRHMTLMANLTLVSLYGFAMHLNAQQMGAFVYMIAAFGTLSQLLLYSKNEQRQKRIIKLRISMALIFVFAGAAVLYEQPIDAIAIVAFACARFAESFTDPRHIRIGFLFSSFLFLCFSLAAGVASVALPQGLLFASLIAAVFMQWRGIQSPITRAIQTCQMSMKGILAPKTHQAAE
jgi:hypothetical protein